MGYWIGVDVGGTFTDVVVKERGSGVQLVHKVPSTPDDPSQAVLQGLAEVLNQLDISGKGVEFLGHGTTAGTNAVLTARGARTALITTRGFRDVLEIGRQQRPSLYDTFADKPPLLAPRELRREVKERVAFDGSVLETLDERAARRELQDLAGKGIEALAICLLHSYANPTHEARLKELALETLPGCFLSVSSELLPEFREYERTSSTVLNAFLGPVVARYLERVERGLQDLRIQVKPFISQANGGLTTIEDARQRPLVTVLSGPAAGIVGAAAFASRSGYRRLIAFDMGGTSTDICLVVDGRPAAAVDRAVAGYPLRLPMLDIETIGAGGGSIAWVDPGGLMKVGPQSAGAMPGPACYGRGGREPTVTDANLVLGRLGVNTRLGGSTPLGEAGLNRSKEAIRSRLASPLSLGLEETAAGVIRIVEEQMAQAVRKVCLEAGYDPRDFVLLAYGGAGPMHASALAVRLGIDTVVVPPNPGGFSAWGLMAANLRADFVQTRLMKVWPEGGAGKAGSEAVRSLEEAFGSLEAKGGVWLERQGVSALRRRLRRILELRYEGQGYELSVECSPGRLNGNLEGLVEEFHRSHLRTYGFEAREKPVWVVNLRVIAEGLLKGDADGEICDGATRSPTLTGENSDAPSGLAGRPVEDRFVFFEEKGEAVKSPVYDRRKLEARHHLQGPAVVEQEDATTLLRPGDIARVNRDGNLVISVRVAKGGSGRTAG